MNHDWDNLIILDACRYDDLEKVCDLPGSLESRISLGVNSLQFLLRNFAGQRLHDTVYITANPHYTELNNNTFFSIVDEPISHWDSELQCVRPEDVTNHAVEANRKYPNKRLIIHYMQPHDPPIGPKGQQLREQIELAGPAPTGHSSSGVRVMEAVENGKISAEKAHEAYRETLEIVLTEVKTLLSKIDGKSVISSDHGEMFGESPYPLVGEMYEHSGLPTEQLCKVPWFTVENQYERRDVYAEPSKNETYRDLDDVNIDDQLEALGYK